MSSSSSSLASVLPVSATLQVHLLAPTAKLPTRGSALAAGYDLAASAPALVPAHGQALVATGLAIIVPEGTYGRVAPRSGLASKHAIHTGAGVVDADYRGEVKVLLFNLSDKDFEVNVGDRVAQLVLEKITLAPVVEITKDQLTDTARGAGGFGSTGGFAGVVVEAAPAPTA